ncbi:MAG: DUF4136 domain-containing protein [Acidobacteriota bacterium]|nr:MAG: DUF4136 domain-containing protein [Acidobacteriota bacterium]
MKARLAVAGAIAAVAIGCSGMKINHDWDRQADFSKYKTYAWYDSDTNIKDTDPLAHERFISAIDSQLAAKGFQKVGSNPDVFVTYNSEESEQMSLDTTYMGGGWGYGPGWGWGGGYGGGMGGGMGGSTTTVRKYSVGTVVLDLWDAKQKRLVWRGTASDTMSDNPQKNATKINAAAEKLFKDYPPVTE